MIASRIDLQEVHIFLPISVIFGVADARSGTCELDLASSKLLKITHTILVLKFAFDDIRPDQESCISLAQIDDETCSRSHGLRVTMRPEASPFTNTIFVDHSKWSEVLELGIVV